jgi:uncharacterized phage-associated protein
MYKSLQIAKKILDLATEKNKTVTPMQLIKLVYLCHGWMLGLYGRPLIKDDIEAWKYGPVIPNLYHEVKNYRSNPVEKINCADCVIDKDSEDVINQVYEKYGHLSGITLSMVTHETDSPWEKTWNNDRTIISNDLIAHYYQMLAEQNG